MFLDHVFHAEQGCDLDVVLSFPDRPQGTEPLGLLSGWVGGW